MQFSDKNLLLDADRFNDPPRDITALLDPTLKSWDEQEKVKKATRLDTIADPVLHKIASESAVLKWAPDEAKAKFLYCAKNCDPQITLGTKSPSPSLQSNYKVVNLDLKKTYDLPPAYSYDSLADSDHLVLTEAGAPPSVANAIAGAKDDNGFVQAKISVIEADGFNKDEIYAGQFNPNDVFVWPDGSRLMIVSSFPTATASQPNLFGINLK